MINQRVKIMQKVLKIKCAVVQQWLLTNQGFLATLLLSGIIISAILMPDTVSALTGGNRDALRVNADNLTKVLTGNVMRIVAVAGSVFMGIKAYLASSPMLLGGAVGIGLGSHFLLTWIKSTYGLLI